MWIRNSGRKLIKHAQQDSLGSERWKILKIKSEKWHSKKTQDQKYHKIIDTHLLYEKDYFHSNLTLINPWIPREDGYEPGSLGVQDGKYFQIRK